MKIKEIYDFLNSISPFELQETWDNSGLLIGSMDTEVEQICLSLDIDLSLLERLDNDTLLITHHPLIFKPLKSLNSSFYPSSLIFKMIKKNISLISMHTNFDKTHLNKYVAKEILNLEIKEIDEFIIYADINMNFDKLLDLVKEKFNLKILRFTKTCDFIKTLALTTGSGGDLISQIKADCFLTGDLKYHQAFEAKENNISLIDISHFESEMFFPKILEEDLKNFPIKAIISNSKNPFEYK